MKYLGKTFDIHAGGVDLLFPHHENEIAQSEGATGAAFARYFVEGEHLLVNGEKMSKSLGNVYTLGDIETRGLNPLAFRYLALGAHYRSKLNFTWESLEGAQQSLARLHEFIRTLKAAITAPTLPHTKLGAKLEIFEGRFRRAVMDDLDTPRTLAILWEVIRDGHKNPKKYGPLRLLELLYDFDRVLGLQFKDVKKEIIPKKIKALVAQREARRTAQEWKEADSLREKIASLGYTVEDAPDGPKIKGIKPQSKFWTHIPRQVAED